MSVPPMSPSLLQLLWFVRIVEAGSLAEAARRAGTSASAMSKAISRFEQTHGVRLLHRTTHSLSLTDEGDLLFEKGRRLLCELEQVESVLSDLGERSTHGRVRVAAPSAFVQTCIVPELPGFLLAHPEIDIEILSGEEGSDLAANRIDIAIRTGDLSGTPGHTLRNFYGFPWIACATPEYLQRNGVPERPEQLDGHCLIGYRSKDTGQIDNWRFTSPADREAVRYVPRAKHVFDEGVAAWSIVRAGIGIGWAPTWLGLDDLRAGRVVEVMRPWRTTEAPLFGVRLDRRLTPKRTQTVMDFLAGLSSSWGI